MNSITLCAPAKINLFLSVFPKRSDGYHDLDTIFQSVSLYDRLTVEKSDTADIHLTCSDPSLPCDNRNLAYRAALTFFSAFGMSFGVNIHLEKQIPSQAGLGGGSADAAAVLHALNALCDYPFSRQKLAGIGASLGADVPFCVLGGTYHASGIGEVLHKTAPLPSCFLIVAMGDVGVSTKEAYATLDTFPLEQEPHADAALQALCDGDLSKVCASLYNSFERVCPVALPLKQAIADCGANGALMSGSGSAVFGIFTNSERAHFCVDRLKSQGYRAYLCTPLAEEEVFAVH